MFKSVWTGIRRTVVGVGFSFVVLVLAPDARGFQDEALQKALAGVEKDALRDLQRGKPPQQIMAAQVLGPAHAERVIPVLTKYLVDPDPVNRRAAADAFWNLASRKPAAMTDAQPALRSALDDEDPGVAMNAAGALTAMDVPAEQTAAARRRVLQTGGGTAYVQFLAARGLLGLDPSPSLVSPILAYLFEPGTADSIPNRDIAVQALKALVATQDRALIPLMQARLGTEQPATVYLLRAIHDFEPRPDGWTETLLAHTRLRNRDSVAGAWSLVSTQRDQGSIKLWAPLVAERLGQPDTRSSALAAISLAAGKTSIGLDALAKLAGNPTASARDREIAIEVLGQAASEGRADSDPAVAAAARGIWKGLCDPILGGEPFGKRFEACFDQMPYVYQDNGQAAEVLTVWLGTNRDAEAKRGILSRIGRTGSKGYPSTDAVRRELAHPDPRVVKAAEAALDLIRPAWRESAALQERTGSVPKPQTADVAPGPGADGDALFEAVRLGQVAEVKKLVNAANIHKPVVAPWMTGGTPIPLKIAVQYCRVPELTEPLTAIVEYLMSLGANPDIVTQGENLLDEAKSACPPQVMRLLVR